MDGCTLYVLRRVFDNDCWRWTSSDNDICARCNGLHEAQFKFWTAVQNTTMIYVDVSTVGRTLEGLSCSTNTPAFTSPRSAYWFYFRRPITKFSALECNMSIGYWVQFAVIKLTCCSIPYYLGTYCFLSLTQNRCSIFLHRRPRDLLFFILNAESLFNFSSSAPHDFTRNGFDSTSLLVRAPFS